MAELIYTPVLPTYEFWFGPDNIKYKDFAHRHANTTQHIFSFGGESLSGEKSPIQPDSMVRLDFGIGSNRPSEYYGPGTTLGLFVSTPNGNRNMSVNPNDLMDWYFVFIGKEGA
jgi:hypothetical protein